MFNPNSFESLTDNSGLARGPVGLADFDFTGEVSGPVPLPESYICTDITNLEGGEVCHGPGEQLYPGNMFTFDIASAAAPTVPGWPLISINPNTFVVPGATLRDFIPDPVFMTVQIEWAGFVFYSYKNGCYIDPDTGQPMGCGNSVLNQPEFTIDTGGYALDVRHAEDETWSRMGLERNPAPLSGLIEFEAVEDTGDPEQWPMISEAPNEETLTATIPGQSAYVKIADAYDLAAVGGYTGRMDNDAHRYLIPWGSLDTITVGWADHLFGEISGGVTVRVALFWEYDYVAGGAYMDLV